MPELPDIATPRCPRCAYDLTGQTAATPASSTVSATATVTAPTDFPSPSPLPLGEAALGEGSSGEGGRAQRDRERGLGLRPPPPFSAWTHACPLTATCPECGLTFDWADLLQQSRQRIPWLYEHANHWWDVRRAWGTCFRALAPWWFWRRVGIQGPVRWRRALLTVLLPPLSTLLAMSLASLVIGMIAIGRRRMQMGKPLTLGWIFAPEWLGDLLKAFLAFNVFIFNAEPFVLYWRMAFGSFVASGIIGALIACAVPSSLAGTRVRRVHFVHAGLLSMAPFAFLYTLWAGWAMWEWYVPSLGPSRANFPWRPPNGSSLIFTHEWWPLAVALLWQPVWWGCALWRGLRLRRTIVLWLFVSLGACLAGAIAALSPFFYYAAD